MWTKKFVALTITEVTRLLDFLNSEGNRTEGGYFISRLHRVIAGNTLKSGHPLMVVELSFIEAVETRSHMLSIMRSIYKIIADKNN